MRTYFLLSVLLIFVGPVAFAQKDTTVLSREETKKLLSQINLDTVKILREYSEKACKCIDSITVSGKADKEIANDISACIDKQTILYQSIIETNRALKEGNLNIEINVNKESRQYKEYYFRLEEWLSDSCASLKNAMANNNKEGKYSMSKNDKALDQYYKGVDFLKVDNYKEALPWFEKAVKTDPIFAFAWDNIGVCNRNLGKLDNAMDAYRKSLEIDPAGKTALQNIPVIYQFKKEYDKAIEAYNQLLAVFPGDPEGYFGIGRMYILKADLEKGLDNLCKAYNIYTETSSPYRVDAQTLISGIYKEMKANGKEELFNKILKDNHISTK